MNGLRIALGIRAQLLLVLTVFLAIPFLGWGYVRELERVLRDAQEQKLAGTAQAVATALHDRAAAVRSHAGPARDARRGTRRRRRRPPRRRRRRTPAPSRRSRRSCRACRGRPRASGSSTAGSTCSRARVHSTPRRPRPDPNPKGSAKVGRWIERTVLHPLYALVLAQPTEEFSEEGAGATLASMREVDGALAGILTTARRPTPDGRAVVVAAAHPIWVGDQVRGRGRWSRRRRTRRSCSATARSSACSRSCSRRCSSARSR